MRRPEGKTTHRGRTVKRLSLVLAVGLLLPVGLLTPGEAQTLTKIKPSGWVRVGMYCEATFTRNPAVIKTVDNINIKVGGPYPTVPDPEFWYARSPTDPNMPDGHFGIHTVENDPYGMPQREWYETNTSYHDGPFDPGTWTVGIRPDLGVPCSDYNQRVKLTFTLLP